jgi:hypothetical protein
MAKAATILSGRFERVGESGLDERKRVSLAKALESLKGALGDAAGVRFAVYVNEVGQILLSPEIAVPLHELWLYKNPDALAMVLRGLEQVGKSERLKDLGSFEKYADDEIE